MRSKKWICSFAMIISLVSTAQTSIASGDDNLQYWTTGGISVDLDEDWNVAFEEELRFLSDASLYYHHSDIGLVYKGFAEWLDVGLNYRQVFAKDSSGKWQSEHRPHIKATVKGELFGLGLSNRLRFEYRDLPGKKDLWRFRNKLTVKLPWKLTSLNIQPYVADEVFINLDNADLNRNRLYAGLSCDFSPNLKGGLYYLWEASERGGNWYDSNVIGLQLKLHF